MTLNNFSFSFPPFLLLLLHCFCSWFSPFVPPFASFFLSSPFFYLFSPLFFFLLLLLLCHFILFLLLFLLLHSHDKQPAKKKPPPRLFCDICDCFDLHDTEDCPTQTQMPDSPPHTTYHGNKGEERPYCDICEVFGHWTDSCNDDQTF